MDKIKISTPENIELEYELAGIGSRFFGVLIDHVLQLFFDIIVISVTMALLGYFYPNIYTLSDFKEIFQSASAGLLGFMILLLFIINFGYFIFFETIWSGQTPGKKIAQTQVVKDNGEPVKFIDALLRNVFRIIDFMPIYYYVGIGFIWTRKDRKRIGDIVAKTIVVKQKSNLRPVVLPNLNIISDFHVNVSLLQTDDYGLIRDFLIARNRLEHDVRSRICKKLTSLIKERLGISSLDIEPEEFLEVVASEYRKYKKNI